MTNWKHLIENEIDKYSMSGDWRSKRDKIVIDAVASICMNAGYSPQKINEDVYKWIHEALCNHKGVMKYFHTIGKLPLDKVADNAVRNICKRLGIPYKTRHFC